MAKNKTENDGATTNVKIDEYAEDVFKHMLGKDTVPEGLKVLYKRAKKLQSKVHPAQLSVEAFTILTLQYQLVNGE